MIYPCNVPDKIFGLEYNTSKLELLWAILNQFEKRFVYRLIKDGQNWIRLNPIYSV